MGHRKPLYVLAALAVTAGGVAAGLGLLPSLAAAAQCLYVGDPSCEQDSTTPGSGTSNEGTYNAPPPQPGEEPWPCPQDYYFGWDYTTSAPVGYATFFIRYGTFYPNLSNRYRGTYRFGDVESTDRNWVARNMRMNAECRKRDDYDPELDGIVRTILIVQADNVQYDRIDRIYRPDSQGDGDGGGGQTVQVEWCLYRDRYVNGVLTSSTEIYCWYV